MSMKLQIRSVQGIVPYDHDLVPEDLDEVFRCGMVPFLEWKTVRFAKWLHDALHDYVKYGTTGTLQERSDAVNDLLMPEGAAKEGGYDPLCSAIAFDNVALVQYVFIPFKYIRQAEELYRKKIFLVTQKRGNIHMLEMIMDALAERKVDDE